MTMTEGIAIVSGLLIGYWLIAVFLPGLRKDDDAPGTGDGLPPGAERDAPPSSRDVSAADEKAKRTTIDL